MDKFKIIAFLFFLMGAGSILSLILSTVFRVTNCNKICQNSFSFSESCFNCRENANPFGGDGTLGKVAITIFAISFVGFATSGFLTSRQHEIRINERILRQDQTVVNDIELDNNRSGRN